MNTDSLTAAQISDFFEQNPNFFIHHPQLLQYVNVAHGLKGATSILEYQNARLKQEKQKFDEILQKAKYNDEVFQRVKLIILDLLDIKDKSQLLYTVKMRFISNFNMHIHVMTSDEHNHFLYKLNSEQIKHLNNLTENGSVIITNVSEILMRLSTIDDYKGSGMLYSFMNNENNSKIFILFTHQEIDYFRLKSDDLLIFLAQIIAKLFK
jgi:hypothetical protein